MRDTCKHCQQDRKIQGRGLCHACWLHHRDDYQPQRSTKPWTSKELALVRKYYGLFKTVKLAAQLGRSMLSVSSAAHRLGVSKDRAVIARDPEKVEKIRKLHGEGLTRSQIAAAMDCSTTTVRDVLRKTKQ